MTYTIQRKYKTKGKTTRLFLCNYGSFISNPSLDELFQFDNLADAVSAKNDAERKADLKHKGCKDKVVKVSDLIDKGMLTVDEPIKMRIAGIEDMVKKLKQIDKNVMFLSLIYYYDKRSSHLGEKHISQISGIMLKNDHHFNQAVFEPEKIDTSEQIKFLSHTSYNYEQAQKFTLKFAMQKLKHFLEENKVNTIVFWENSTGHNLRRIENEGYIKLFKGIRFLNLEKVLTKDADNSDNLSLKNACALLNVHVKQEDENTAGFWQNPFYQVQMAKKVCESYLYFLNRRSRNKLLFQLKNNKKSLDN